MKKILKKIVKSVFVQNVACAIAASYILFVKITSRIEIRQSEIPQNFWDNNQPFILAFWHGQLFSMPFFWRTKKDIYLLISKHRDGQLIGKTVSYFGFKFITGSSAKTHKKDKDKGGKEAFMKMIKTIKNGDSIGLTPDGPRGPRMKGSDGVAAVAAITKAPVLPVVAIPKKMKVMKSWDKFILPLPFNKIVLSCAEPLYFKDFEDKNNDKKIAREKLKNKIEYSLNKSTNLLLKELGHDPIFPEK